jgi:hypothetical protein
MASGGGIQGLGALQSGPRLAPRDAQDRRISMGMVLGHGWHEANATGRRGKGVEATPSFGMTNVLATRSGPRRVPGSPSALGLTRGWDKLVDFAPVVCHITASPRWEGRHKAKIGGEGGRDKERQRTEACVDAALCARVLEDLGQVLKFWGVEILHLDVEECVCCISVGARGKR